MRGALADPIDVACRLDDIRREATWRYQWLCSATIDDLVAEAALQILERGHRKPGKKWPPSVLIRYAVQDAMRALRGDVRYEKNRIETSVVDFTDFDLATPSFVAEAEILADRLSEESSADQYQEWTALSVRERADRIAEACVLTATSLP